MADAPSSTSPTRPRNAVLVMGNERQKNRIGYAENVFIGSHNDKLKIKDLVIYVI